MCPLASLLIAVWDDSIDGKGTTWCLPIIPGEEWHVDPKRFATPGLVVSGRLGFDARCHQIPSECIRIPCLNCGGGDRWCRHLSSGKFAALICTVTCIVLKAKDRRTSSPLPR
ncbi:hypothetical protein TNCV_1528791 [Trichonephila clavipes]|nr:hypothetical protein TNCV_1528791 [Trichonephila clavipes]